MCKKNYIDMFKFLLTTGYNTGITKNLLKICIRYHNTEFAKIVLYNNICNDPDSIMKYAKHRDILKKYLTIINMLIL